MAIRDSSSDSSDGEDLDTSGKLSEPEEGKCKFSLLDPDNYEVLWLTFYLNIRLIKGVNF